MYSKYNRKVLVSKLVLDQKKYNSTNMLPGISWFNKNRKKRSVFKWKTRNSSILTRMERFDKGKWNFCGETSLFIPSPSAIAHWIVKALPSKIYFRQGKSKWAEIWRICWYFTGIAMTKFSAQYRYILRKYSSNGAKDSSFLVRFFSFHAYRISLIPF